MTDAANSNTGSGFSNQSDEIEKILAEIEGIESKTATATTAETTPDTSAHALAPQNPSEPVDTATNAEIFDHETEGAASPNAKVIPIKNTKIATESLVETDAHVVHPDPLAFETTTTPAGDTHGYEQSFGGGGLALKVGGCAAISLEFEQNGTRVILTLEKDTLAISTDSGAEFRIPLKGRDAA